MYIFYVASGNLLPTRVQALRERSFFISFLSFFSFGSCTPLLFVFVDLVPQDKSTNQMLMWDFHSSWLIVIIISIIMFVTDF